jgi:plasmid stabilization system protein ParE
MSERLPVVFLVDVDDTLLDNDHIQNDLREHLEREFGAACRDRYWRILEALFEELGYRDYLGALQRYRIEHPTDIRLLGMSSYLVDYPFADRLYPGALELLCRSRPSRPQCLSGRTYDRPAAGCAKHPRVGPSFLGRFARIEPIPLRTETAAGMTSLNRR